MVVDEHDHATGVCGKLAAHQPPGVRHRALSAFVRDRRDRLLLQRRAAGKYHFPGAWSNTCCTHPLPGEDVTLAGERRLDEELGLQCRLIEVGVFTYRAVDPASGLVEHEVDHVLLGRSDDLPRPHPDEVDEVRWATMGQLTEELDRHPARFTPWLAAALSVLRRAIPLDAASPGASDPDAGDH